MCVWSSRHLVFRYGTFMPECVLWWPRVPKVTLNNRAIMWPAKKCVAWQRDDRWQVRWRSQRKCCTEKLKNHFGIGHVHSGDAYCSDERDFLPKLHVCGELFLHALSSLVTFMNFRCQKLRLRRQRVTWHPAASQLEYVTFSSAIIFTGSLVTYFSRRHLKRNILLEIVTI